MRFQSKAEKLEWLKLTALKLSEMEQQRKVEIMKGNFTKAYSLLRGINFAREEFNRVSRTLKPKL